MINNETPLSTPSLHDEIVGRIRDMIFAGEFIGGQRVPEKLLCQQLSVSRTPLREALKVLAAEGLLMLLPNRGARVARMTAEETRRTASNAELERRQVEFTAQSTTLEP